MCCERTMYRIVDVNHEVKERHNQLVHPARAKPELIATGPNQLWSWDIAREQRQRSTREAEQTPRHQDGPRAQIHRTLRQRPAAPRDFRARCLHQPARDDRVAVDGRAASRKGGRARRRNWQAFDASATEPSDRSLTERHHRRRKCSKLQRTQALTGTGSLVQIIGCVTDLPFRLPSC